MRVSLFFISSAISEKECMYRHWRSTYSHRGSENWAHTPESLQITPAPSVQQPSRGSSRCSSRPPSTRTYAQNRLRAGDLTPANDHSSTDRRYEVHYACSTEETFSELNTSSFLFAFLFANKCKRSLIVIYRLQKG